MSAALGGSRFRPVEALDITVAPANVRVSPNEEVQMELEAVKLLDMTLGEKAALAVEGLEIERKGLRGTIVAASVSRREYGRGLRPRDAYEPTGRGRVWVQPTDWSVLENLVNRRNRPYVLWRRVARRAVNVALGLPEETKWAWSQYSGCSCPCSPSFIVDDYRLRGFDVNLTVDVREIDGDLDLGGEVA